MPTRFSNRRIRVKRFSDYPPLPVSMRPSRFSNRPVRVKRFSDYPPLPVSMFARGLALLFGIGTEALPAWDSKTRWNNLWGGLAVKRQ